MAEERRRYYVNADKSKLVDEGSSEAAFMLHEREVKALGLLKETKAQRPQADKAQRPAEDK